MVQKNIPYTYGTYRTRTVHNSIKDRCFQCDWFEKWPWLHYNELNDSAYCFTYMRAIKEKKVKTENVDACFISSGYINWKDATCAFKRHKSSDAHKAAIEVIVTISMCELTLDLSTFHVLPTPLYVTHTYMSKHIHTTHTHTQTTTVSSYDNISMISKISAFVVSQQKTTRR